MDDPYQVKIVGDEMVVLDEDGVLFQRHRLTTFRAAKRQLEQWELYYAFDFNSAMSALAELFGRSLGVSIARHEDD